MSSLEYLVVGVGAELFAVPADRVRTTMLLSHSGLALRASHVFQGIIDFRGTAVPVMDLGQRLGCTAELPESEPFILLVRLSQLTAQDVILGVMVDRIGDRVRVPKSSCVQPSPDESRHCYCGVFVLPNGRICTLLDVDRLI